MNVSSKNDVFLTRGYKHGLPKLKPATTWMSCRNDGDKDHNVHKARLT